MSILKKFTALTLISMMFAGAVSSTAYAKTANEKNGLDRSAGRAHS